MARAAQNFDSTTCDALPVSSSYMVFTAWFVQVLYAGEGESRKPGDSTDPPQLKDLSTLEHKGHDLVPISFHMPTTCELCPKPLWHMFKPPPALECRRCRLKLHRDHVDMLAPCKVDPTSAKELLLLAPTTDDQRRWISRGHPPTQVSSTASSSSNTSASSVSGPGGKAATLPSRKC
ncbi:hypothetical protein MTO96_028684 [Rhipicephalus appendiculatus]